MDQPTDESPATQATPPTGHGDTAAPFREFASSWERRAPLYATLAAAIAAEPEVHGILLRAPETQRLPVLLFASVHHLLLDHQDHELASWYPNMCETPRSPDDPALAPAFRDFVAVHHDAISELVATRTTQTNEVGRCSWFVVTFGLLAAEVGPIGHLDVGTSAGLTLLFDRYQYRFAHDGADVMVGEPSPVVVPTSLRGDVPVPDAVPSAAGRIGIDRDPIDVTDDVQARWLEACVWPDQLDRFHRLEAAIDLARRSPPEIIAGDAVTLLAEGVEKVGAHGHPVVTNSWVLNYFTSAQRVAYLAELDRIGARRHLSWVFAESPSQVPELPCVADPDNADLTVLTVVRWRGGARTVETVATCHPHGYWLRWR